LIYLPINIYAGYFNAEHLLPNLLKDIVFDGTFYHLWYLPGAMLGALITCFLLSKLKTEHAFAAALGLYVIGLFGDSYYGISAKIPFLKSFYDVVFIFSDYTRNGLFFAPIFLLLGGMVAKYKRLRLTVSFTGLIISSILLLAEGLLLRQFHVQRHDSMYFMLLPCMVFLFHTVLFWEGRGIRSLRNLSMIIYLVHPLMIVLIRGLAKATDLQQLLIDNSVVHFLAVAFSSYSTAMAIQIMLRKRKSGLN
jgi:serine/alanine racemase